MLNAIKSKMKMFKRQFARVEVIKKMQSPLYGFGKSQEPIAFSPKGFPIYLDNDSVQSLTGAYPHEPSAAAATAQQTGQRAILINDAMLNYKHKDAVILHEEGHIATGQIIIENIEQYHVDIEKASGYGQECEYEADAYAVVHGADMLAALEDLGNILGMDKSLHKRIIRLRMIQV